ncbi:hypothetical protein SK128_007038 [Halocaridina rubra]|uniref:receptor protein-tyrosine kinase n=1 Tax=Halocaridina rubra TaxID=373956 RepID=A0AAN8XD09_HALRR
MVKSIYKCKIAVLTTLVFSVAQAVKRYSLQEEDYHKLLLRFNEHISACNSSSSVVFDTEKIIEDIACDWLRETKYQGVEVWRNWLPNNYVEKTALWIAGIFPSIDGLGIYPMPQGGASVVTSGTLPNAAQMAISRINTNTNILHDYEILLMVQAGRCKSEDVMASFINYITLASNSSKYSFEKMIGILGPACSDTVEPLVGVANRFETVVLSYSAEGAIFDEQEKYPSFFRTIPENKMYGSVYLELFKLFEWRQVASLAEHCNKYSEYLKLLDEMLPKEISLSNFRFPRTATRNMTEHLMKVKEKTFRIIIGDFYANTGRQVLCEAYRLNMTAKYNYVWFLPRWFDENWYEIQPNDNLPCNNSMMLEAIDRHMSLGYAYYAPLDSYFHEGITVQEWQEEYIDSYGNKSQHPADYAGYTYDAVWTYAFALDKLLKEERAHVANLHSHKSHKRFVELLRQTDFDGVSGNIKFKSGRAINIMQFVVDQEKSSGDYVKIGQFDPPGDGSNMGRLSLVKSEARFFHGIPTDGIVPPACLFQTFSDVLNVSCDIAIVIVMALIFLVFAIFLIALFFVYKKKFEKIPEQPVWPLGELISLDKWEIPREKVVINRTLGEGVFGTVYGGECQFGESDQWTAVAVKTLKVGSAVEEKLDFFGEAEMMKRFNHKNIIQLLGMCTHQEPVYLIMEFMLYGDLKTYLLARRHLVSDKSLQTEEDEVSSKRLTSMALDACRALAYLAEHRYVHRDVACRNCLVSSERIVKLSDFGMTRPIYESEYYRFNRRGMMPVRWMSPEAIEEGLFTNMSDMWSFGVLLYEIITFGSFPFQGMNNNQVVEFVRSGGTITIPSGVKPQLERILKSCWSKDPYSRPTFNEMLENLTMSPRLITPCLGVPSAAVQMTGTESLEMVIAPPETGYRRRSVPNVRNPSASVVTTYGNESKLHSNEAQFSQQGKLSLAKMPLSKTPGPPISPVSLNSSKWSQLTHENGKGVFMEPLLPQNGAPYFSPFSCYKVKKADKTQTDLHFPTPNRITTVIREE